MEACGNHVVAVVAVGQVTLFFLVRADDLSCTKGRRVRVAAHNGLTLSVRHRRDSELIRIVKINPVSRLVIQLSVFRLFAGDLSLKTFGKLPYGVTGQRNIARQHILCVRSVRRRFAVFILPAFPAADLRQLLIVINQDFPV